MHFSFFWQEITHDVCSCEQVDECLYGVKERIIRQQTWRAVFFLKLSLFFFYAKAVVAHEIKLF